MNIFLTGLPGIGKTTIIKKVIEKLNRSTCGFFTNEEREGETRVGFKIETLFGMQGVLAHKDLKSKYRVGNYGIAVTGFEKIVSRELERCLRGSSIIIIDEIGKMECMSPQFVTAMRALLHSRKPVVATIARRGGGFITEVKARKDAELWEVTRANRDGMPQEVLTWFREERL